MLRIWWRSIGRSKADGLTTAGALRFRVAEDAFGSRGLDDVAMPHLLRRALGATNGRKADGAAIVEDNNLFSLWAGT